MFRAEHTIGSLLVVF